MKIICFGDSLTRGVSVVKGRLRILKENYPASLQDLFSQKETNDVTVINKGVFNDNSELMLSRLEKDVIEEHPDFAIVEVGGNDCNFKWNEIVEKPEEDHQAIVSLDRYLANIKEIVTKLQESGVKPIIATLPPLDPVRYYQTISNQYNPSVGNWVSKLGGIEHWHGMYNYHLNKLADELTIPKIDVRSAIKKAGDLVNLISEDGIHLTAEGYHAFSKAVYQYLVNSAEEKTV
ncbi:SGNH/GDSL hydrolase family protein [Aquibacillus rhizosphaerae]|uniref:GDSL-type esterase/lipase family protein n=1 Tax=Aquibacillus rhizosphaerae TaxID=3051431 RepID=A0ABT7L2V4_9BACI|nr:GDSL-type esterase/lipase family protein [Aquibacillus sp. LR5S19]MDL4840198.1 GDSL-type esterase/lipase family protein [Aquibacillus sp. LR5S19]